jgi:hypothetical protein
MREKDVVNLLAAAGLFSGVGDWRTEKGSGNYGSFELVAADDPRFIDLIEHSGRAAQTIALNDPTCYDDESAALLQHHTEYVTARGFKARV